MADQTPSDSEAIAYELRQLRLTVQKLDNTISAFRDQVIFTSLPDWEDLYTASIICINCTPCSADAMGVLF